VWEVTPGEFLGENLEFSEHVHILGGEATVTSEDGTSVELRPGVSFLTQAGWRGAWSVRKTVRKIYVVWRTPWWRRVCTSSRSDGDGAPSRRAPGRSEDVGDESGDESVEEDGFGQREPEPLNARDVVSHLGLSGD
jgi:EutQ-like cupin domain